MSKLFKKSGELELVNGGYLSVKGSTEVAPVYNEKFVVAQKRAHVLVSIAAAISGKNFESTIAEDKNDILKSVLSKINETQSVEFVKVSEAKQGKITESLRKEALDFINGTKDQHQNEFLNEKMQEFAIVKEFEDFGLFFVTKATKLSAIYSIEEITAAAKSVYSVYTAV